MEWLTLDSCHTLILALPRSTAALTQTSAFPVREVIIDRFGKSGQCLWETLRVPAPEKRVQCRVSCRDG